MTTDAQIVAGLYCADRPACAERIDEGKLQRQIEADQDAGGGCLLIDLSPMKCVNALRGLLDGMVASGAAAPKKAAPTCQSVKCLQTEVARLQRRTAATREVVANFQDGFGFVRGGLRRIINDASNLTNDNLIRLQGRLYSDGLGASAFIQGVYQFLYEGGSVPTIDRN